MVRMEIGTHAASRGGRSSSRTAEESASASTTALYGKRSTVSDDLLCGGTPGICDLA